MKLFRGLKNRLSSRSSKNNPSVEDFKTEKELKSALKKDKNVIQVTITDSHTRETLSDSDTQSAGSVEAVEWMLPLVDTKSTEPQSMEEEFKRLQVLQSYFVLDSAGEDEFDRITRLASLMFDAPIALVSLIDLGRQWFLSKVGLDADETPRKHAFCAHVILNKYKILVVPDASQDIRFKDNPLVTGPPHIRFYAGAALVAPEGHKLGTLCVISPLSRPQGLNEEEQKMLHEMAGIVVNTMVARRVRLLKEQCEKKIRDLGQSFVETSNSLKHTKASISSIVTRGDSPLHENDTKVLAGVVNDLEVQANVCAAAARSLLERDDGVRGQEVSGSAFFDADDFESRLDDILEPTTDLKDLLTKLQKIVTTFPRKVPLIMSLDASVPNKIISEDLLLFRSSLNLIMYGLGRAVEGTEVNFRISTESDYLLFECQDSGRMIPKDRVKLIFHDEQSLLAPTATMVRTMNGYYGMRIVRFGDIEGPPPSIFWFRIPIQLPESMAFADSSTETIGTPVQLVLPAQTLSDRPKNGIAEDPFRAALIEGGCLGQ